MKGLPDNVDKNDVIRACLLERRVIEVRHLEAIATAVVVDVVQVVGVAWDMVEDGDLTYGADAKFRRTSD